MKRLLSAALAVTAAIATAPGLALAAAPTPNDVIQDWYKMVLELTRHTATMSPPVASRAYGYIGVTADEIVASGSEKRQTRAGQRNGRDGGMLSSEPMRIGGQPGDELRATGKDTKAGIEVEIVQWLRFGSGAYMQMVGFAPKEGWIAAFTRFRTVRDGLEPR